MGVGSQKGNRGNPCTVPEAGPWVQDGSGQQPRPQAPAQSAQSTWDPKIPAHQHNRAAPPTPTPKPSIHQRQLTEHPFESIARPLQTEHSLQDPDSKSNPSYIKSEQHNICILFSMLGGCLYRRQGLHRRMGVGSQEPAHCSRGGAVGAASVGPQPTWSPKSAPTCILNRAHGLARLLQNTPRSAYSTHLERTLDANRSAHSMPSP